MAIDDFYEYKLASWCGPQSSAGDMVDNRVLAERFAARWIMIPCSRAIDTRCFTSASRLLRSEWSFETWPRDDRDFVDWIRVSS